MLKIKNMILVAVLIPVFSLNASAAQPAQTPAINIYVDVLLGVISEDEAKEKIESLKHDFKSTLKLNTGIKTATNIIFFIFIIFKICSPFFEITHF